MLVYQRVMILARSLESPVDLQAKNGKKKEDKKATGRDTCAPGNPCPRKAEMLID